MHLTEVDGEDGVWVGKEARMPVESASELRGKDLVGIDPLSPDEIQLILDTAEQMLEVAQRPIKKVPALRGKTVVNLFMEPSTRTRFSFEVAEKRLSADSLNFSASTSSVSKGETLVDTARNLMAMQPDFIVIRHPLRRRAAPARQVAEVVGHQRRRRHQRAPDAGAARRLDDAPALGHLEGLNVVIAGDIRHSRVARSNVFLLTKMGATVRVRGRRPRCCLQGSRSWGDDLPPPRARARRRRRGDDAANPARAAGRR